MPKGIDIKAILPLLDFDDDSCYPSAAVSRVGRHNGGLRTTGFITGGCRNKEFLDYSISYHRYACRDHEKKKYCGHMFALYFQKDQMVDGLDPFGHRHDFEYVAVWTTDGVVTHASASAHGDAAVKPIDQIPHSGEHIKFVFHKDEPTTHSMRFAEKNHDEDAENSYGDFVLPAVVSWYTMQGDGNMTNDALRGLMNSLDFGDAHNPLLDGDFLDNLNEAKAKGYPQFDDEDVKGSQ
ncbi:hypothetical protein Poli38472_009945 [Pythium oligandrum]|uniref:Necrosis inducing protein n=1 Tax=Pythium oligandrum TaxID=41045 RepID=A0A8K1C819_PYTOL|nr:hypothetical protein Poli38472_009945 [Pythium oligandrum]|eukprot:TMW58386.1 hypothetical protein Poli38472_009945 [Pythium oligandrum]